MKDISGASRGGSGDCRSVLWNGRFAVIRIVMYAQVEKWVRQSEAEYVPPEKFDFEGPIMVLILLKTDKISPCHILHPLCIIKMVDLNC